MKIIIINGPNINLLGIREINVYGSTNYKEMCSELYQVSEHLELELEIVQSNIEGELINFIHSAYSKYDGIIINPGAYTHYSIAIHDAIKAVSVPTIEVHISNIHTREEFRKISVTAPACIGQLCGFGVYGYTMALNALKKSLIDKGIEL